MNAVEIITFIERGVAFDQARKAGTLGPSAETIKAARAVVGPNVADIERLETTLQDWREATYETLPRLAMMAKIACRMAGHIPTAAAKKECECPIGAACPCRNPACDRGWITEADVTGHELARRCDECPRRVPDAPVNPWA